jgi:hypothetical protein
MALIVNAPTIPATVALTTLAQGEGFFLNGKHYLVGNTGQFCLEDSTIVALGAAVQVFKQTPVEITFA